MSTAPVHPALALALQHHQAGRFAEAEALYRQILATQPDHADALHLLGVVVHQTGRHDLAVEWIRQAIAIAPHNPAAHSNLGEACRSIGRVDEAMDCYRRAIQLNPQYALAYYNLGNVLRERDQLDEAVTAYRQAQRFKPDHAETYNNLGMALVGRGTPDEAVTAYHRALQLKPDYADAHCNLGVALKDQGRLDQAAAAFRRALQLQPNLAEAHNNLGNTLKDQGLLDEAIAEYRRAVELKPDLPGIHSNLVYTLPLHPDQDERAVREEQRRWNRQFGEPAKQFIRPQANDRDPRRRLRIGYVSPDFHFHAVPFFLVPLLEAHDHQLHEIYCYASDLRSDAATARLRKSADIWREVHAFSDAQLAECVRADGIDILVDLAMHTTDNRLPAFARRPAPVQVSWLAYAGRTGLEAIDYRLTDAHIDPVGEEDAMPGEQAVRLPDSWCCYEPIESFPPVGPLPAAQKKSVTFGSLNQFCKTNEALLRCWARLLQAVPESRLLMSCPEGQARERTHAFFATRGITRERVELVALCPWPDYIRLFERVDVALDSFPCNGMTTTCHALWMGVPVVTRVGTNAVSRAGNSLLHTLGLPEWIASSEEEYLRIATEWAADLPRLAELRQTLRPRMQVSPLMDAPRFAHHIEAAYRTLWQRWCAAKES